MAEDIVNVGYKDLSDDISQTRNVVFVTSDPDQGPLHSQFFSLTPDVNHLFPFSWSRFAFDSVQRVVAGIDYLVQNSDDPCNGTKLHHALTSNKLVYNGVIKSSLHQSSAGNIQTPFSFVTFKGQSLTDLVAHRSTSGDLTMINKMNLQPSSFCGDGFATGNEQVCIEKAFSYVFVITPCMKNNSVMVGMDVTLLACVHVDLLQLLQSPVIVMVCEILMWLLNSLFVMKMVVLFCRLYSIITKSHFGHNIHCSFISDFCRFNHCNVSAFTQQLPHFKNSLFLFMLSVFQHIKSGKILKLLRKTTLIQLKMISLLRVKASLKVMAVMLKWMTCMVLSLMTLKVPSKGFLSFHQLKTIFLVLKPLPIVSQQILVIVFLHTHCRKMMYFIHVLNSQSLHLSLLIPCLQRSLAQVQAKAFHPLNQLTQKNLLLTNHQLVLSFHPLLI